MSNNSHTHATPPARTHAEAAAMFRRPFAPGAIGFRAMTKVPFNGQPYAGAQVAAYIGAQSVIQRLNAVVPGRWRQQFQTLPTEFTPASSRRDLGEILAHGEPENGIGQGEVADQAAQPTSEPPAPEPATLASNGHGEVVTVDFGDLGPAAA